MEVSAIAVALGAGILAAFNPCGFALLPTYLTMFLGPDQGKGSSVRRALVVGASVTVGFLAVFAVAGVAVSALSVTLGDWLSVLTGVSGLLLVLGGIYVLSGREFSARLPRANLQVSGSNKGMVAYGIVYATVSLSCTLPIFLAAVISVFSVPGAGFIDGLVALLAYGLGMGLVLTVLALGMALFRDATISRMRRITPYMNRVSGIFLVLAGTYVLWYAWVEYQSFQGNFINSGPVAWFNIASGKVGQFVLDAGAWQLALFGLAFLALASITGFMVCRRKRAAEVGSSGSDSTLIDAPTVSEPVSPSDTSTQPDNRTAIATSSTLE